MTDLDNGVPREVDIEGVTRLGNRIFWIGSHSHDAVSIVRPNRCRIFATDVSGSGAGTQLAYAGRYDYLKLDLIDWDNGNGHGKGPAYYGLELSGADGTDPKTTSGFNIEGLTMAPGSTTTAYVAFRAPIAPATNRFYALIVPVLNFTSLAVSNGPPGSARFGQPIELDLYGRGIRSIEGDTNGYLIVGGASADVSSPYPNDFRLYYWSGHPDDQPDQLAADLTGLNPEAIVELPPHPWTPQSQVQLLSDNGRTVYYNDGIVAKRLPETNFKKFRSDVVTLGPIVKPAPLILSTTVSNSQVLITWRARRTETYRVQFKPFLASTSWTDLGQNVVATGPVASQLDPNPTDSQRFYRVIVLP